MAIVRVVSPLIHLAKRLSRASCALAILPLTLTPAGPLPHGLPCAIAVDVQENTALQWGATEWQSFTNEVERIWKPYGVSLCWGSQGSGCAGWLVRLRVLVESGLFPDNAREVGPVVGRIFFDANGPTSDIGLSVAAARRLLLRASIGDRRLEDWPVGYANPLLPRVLGRALAHEIGHYVLGSRTHSRGGLMATSLRPDQVTFGSTSGFRLPAPEGAVLRQQCLPGGDLTSGRADPRSNVHAATWEGN